MMAFLILLSVLLPIVLALVWRFRHLSGKSLSRVTVYTVAAGACFAALAALPGMIFSALNPVIAVKTIGGTVYNVIGGGIHSILGIVMLAFVLLLIVFAILTVCFLFSLFGPFAIGLIVIVKFVLNLQYFK